MIDVEVKVVFQLRCVRSVVFCKLCLHVGTQRGPLVRDQRLDYATIDASYQAHERVSESSNLVPGPETLPLVEVLESDRIREPNQSNPCFRVDAFVAPSVHCSGQVMVLLNSQKSTEGPECVLRGLL